jgi:hypothetical protein
MPPPDGPIKRVPGTPQAANSRFLEPAKRPNHPIRIITACSGEKSGLASR